MNPFALSGKRALVTGGTRGIGEAIAVALKEAGYRVAANYAGNEQKAQEFTERTRIPAYRWDVADYAACLDGVARVESDLGPIEVLINNAGITRDGTMHRMDFDAWNDVIQTNLASCFNMSRAVIEGMRERAFVLTPLADLAPGLPVPGTGATVADKEGFRRKVHPSPRRSVCERLIELCR